MESRLPIAAGMMNITRRQTQDLSATNADLRSSLAQMRNQLQVVSYRLNQVATQPPAAVESRNTRPGLIDQPRQLSGAREEIDKTRDELEGSIAKNHDELVELEKRGERNSYEFEIDKSKQFSKVGPLSVSLRKVNQKAQVFTTWLSWWTINSWKRST